MKCKTRKFTKHKTYFVKNLPLRRERRIEMRSKRVAHEGRYEKAKQNSHPFSIARFISRLMRTNYRGSRSSGRLYFSCPVSRERRCVIEVHGKRDVVRFIETRCGERAPIYVPDPLENAPKNRLILKIKDHRLSFFLSLSLSFSAVCRRHDGVSKCVQRASGRKREEKTGREKERERGRETVRRA